MLNKTRNLKNFFIVFAALISVFGLSINLNVSDPNRIFFLFIFIILIFLINKAIKVSNKNLFFWSIILALIVAVIEFVGYSLHTSDGIDALYSSWNAIIKNSIAFIGLTIILNSGFVLLFDFIYKFDFSSNNNHKFSFLSNKKTFFFIWLIIFLAWIPWFLIYYPGICTFDSFFQIHMALGDCDFSSHHPVFHTFIIGICLKIGFLFGGINTGIAIYSLLQMLIMSGIFSFAVYYMGKKRIHQYIRLCSVIFFAVFPINVLYSFTMWKDIFFGGIMLLFTICVIEMITNTNRFFIDRKFLILFTVVTILVILLRNNGVYVVLLSFPFFIIFTKKFRMKLLTIFLFCLLFFVVFTGPVYSVLDIHKGPIGEALSVPLQQMARVEKYRGDELSSEELEIIQSVLPVENIGDYYNPRLSDPVKNHFDDEYFASHTFEFFSTWAKMSQKFPKEYFESYLLNSYGYWYPEVVYWIVATDICDNRLGAEQRSFSPETKSFLEKNVIFYLRQFPVTSMLYSIGFGFILLLVLFFYLCIKKQYIFLLAFVPVLCLILTTTASPVYAEYRYVYSLFTCLPLLFAFALHKQKVK